MYQPKLGVLYINNYIYNIAYSRVRGIVKLTKEDCGSIYDELSLKALELELQDQLIKYYPLLCPAPKETFESLVLLYAFFFKV